MTKRILPGSGIPYTGGFTPLDVNSTYPLFDPAYALGGYRNVNLLTDLVNAQLFPQPRLQLGLMAYVELERRLYILNNLRQTVVLSFTGSGGQAGGSGTYAFVEVDDDGNTLRTLIDGNILSSTTASGFIGGFVNTAEGAAAGIDTITATFSGSTATVTFNSSITGGPSNRTNRFGGPAGRVRFTITPNAGQTISITPNVVTGNLSRSNIFGESFESLALVASDWTPYGVTNLGDVTQTAQPTDGQILKYSVPTTGTPFWAYANDTTGTGTVTTGRSLGSGEAVYEASSSTASTLDFRSLVESNNIQLNQAGTSSIEITISDKFPAIPTTDGSYILNIDTVTPANTAWSTAITGVGNAIGGTTGVPIQSGLNTDADTILIKRILAGADTNVTVAVDGSDAGLIRVSDNFQQVPDVIGPRILNVTSTARANEWKVPVLSDNSDVQGTDATLNALQPLVYREATTSPVVAAGWQPGPVPVQSVTSADAATMPATSESLVINTDPTNPVIRRIVDHGGASSATVSLDVNGFVQVSSGLISLTTSRTNMPADPAVPHLYYIGNTIANDNWTEAEVGALSNVTLTTPSATQVLSIGSVDTDGTVNWVNADQTSGGGDVTCELSGGGVAPQSPFWNTTPASTLNSLPSSTDNGGFTWVVGKSAVSISLKCGTSGPMTVPAPADGGAGLAGNIALTSLTLQTGTGTALDILSASTGVYVDSTGLITITYGTRIVYTDFPTDNQQWNIAGNLTLDSTTFPISSTISYLQPGFTNALRTLGTLNTPIDFNSTITQAINNRNEIAAVPTTLLISRFGNSGNSANDTSLVIGTNDQTFTLPTPLTIADFDANTTAAIALRSLFERMRYTNSTDTSQTRDFPSSTTFVQTELSPTFYYPVYIGFLTQTEFSNIAGGTSILNTASRFSRLHTDTTSVPTRVYDWPANSDATRNHAIIAFPQALVNANATIVATTGGNPTAPISKSATLNLGTLSNSASHRPYNIYLYRDGVSVATDVTVAVS